LVEQFEASVNSRLRSTRPLRAWAQTIHIMLPTTAGMVLVPALSGGAIPRHRLVATADVDPD
jgi:hypothetical protein